METFWPAFAALIVVAGPWKASIVFAEKTSEMDTANRRRTASLSVLIATIVAIVVMFFGLSLVKLFHIEPAGFLIGAGLIVVVFAIRMVIAPTVPNDGVELTPATSTAVAVYPLAIPLIITPPAVAALTAIGIDAALTDEAMIGAVLALLAVMAINLGAFSVVARFEDRVHHAAWDVAGRLLGIFLAAFGVSIIIEGTKYIG